jgi:predicted DNA-binding protein YlxM (UPF0122 family)
MEKKQSENILPFRRLDFDDLIVLAMLSSTVKFREISETLAISRSAISHRLNKFRFLFEGFEIVLDGGNKILSQRAIDLSYRAKEVLKILITIGESNVKTDNQEEQPN